jgi:hypothetical protein
VANRREDLHRRPHHSTVHAPEKESGVTAHPRGMATRWQISPARGSDAGVALVDGECQRHLGRLLRGGWVHPGPTKEERGVPVRSGEGEPVAEIGEGAAVALPASGRSGGGGGMDKRSRAFL